MVQVVLNLLSGQQDPTWTLTAGNAAELHRLLTRASGRPGAPAPGLEPLGYRGFTILDSEDEQFDHAHIFKGVLVMPGDTVAHRAGIEIERFLVDHLPEAVDRSFRSYLETEIAGVP